MLELVRALPKNGMMVNTSCRVSYCDHILTVIDLLTNAVLVVMTMSVCLDLFRTPDCIVWLPDTSLTT